MAGVCFMNGYDIGCVIIEGGEPFLLLQRRPISLDRSHVVIGFSRTGFEWTGRVHGRETGGALKLRCLLYSRPNLRRDRHNVALDQELTNALKILARVRNEALRGRMVLL